jgi:hypothetical protein
MLIENEQNTHIAAKKWIGRVAYLQAYLLESGWARAGLERAQEHGVT